MNREGMREYRWRAGSGVVVCLLAMGLSTNAAAQKAAAQDSTNVASGGTAAAVTPVSFEPPENANPDQLVDFLAEMITFEPRTKEEAAQYQQLAPAAMNKAALDVLRLEQDRSSDNYRFAAKYLLAVEAMTIGNAKPDRRQEVMGQIAALLRSPKLDADDLDIAVTFAEGLEMAGDTRAASAAYSQFSKILARQKDPLAMELSQLMAGATRRLNLLGEPLQVTGTTLEGKPFEWSQFQGKVVLIDFWATWCGPCLQELPHIRAAYEAYHDQGFEVVSISMDEDRAQLDEFMTQHPFPWPTLHEGKGAMNPTALYYGISALPSTILVDQSGRVVSMAARGKELDTGLKKLLGRSGR